ncbi:MULTISPECIES: carbohydrate ABC transporter permease [Paenibacillus]|uniref:Carbohydrate ABC transporter permease n=1 Tax=Paenibacillus lentus TaxID=1338368 RepID=A0A3Q8S400_9BACL|nr:MULTISPECIES: carbohydrate ABC transporter permease [Paenibacillus]AZK45635.1 carbohydrate ABC transporter permease [Paenibacillus lentus]
MNKSAKIKASIGLYFVYILISLFFLLPFLWLVSLSFKTVPELFAVPPKFLPNQFNFDNYKYVLWKTDIFGYLKNSLVIIFATVIGTLILTLPAAYAFSRFDYRGKKATMLAVLFFQMISPLIIVIPLYKYLSSLGMLNNYGSLIFVYIAVALPFAVWSVKGYVDTVPRELDEAAAIDGCNKFQTMYMAILPLVVPGIVSVVILVVVKSWAQFIVPFILLNDSSMYPISVGLVNLQSTADSITTHYLAAAAVIAIFPTLIIFIILQRFIVSAMTAGAVKG